MRTYATKMQFLLAVLMGSIDVKVFRLYYEEVQKCQKKLFIMTMWNVLKK